MIMNILQVLSLLQLLAGAASTPTQPVQDHWGEFGAYGPCSRSCGTGVARRTRKCITLRTDGGHNCLGSSKSFRTCNTHACPAGSRNFREEQCSQFDSIDFQGKHHTWVAYYGASNACELNCSPRGENIFYRHRPAVVDGTPCYVGRTDICVDGVCRIRIQEEFMGLDEDANPTDSAAPIIVPYQQRLRLIYIYKTGVYGECSVSCDGGMQYRSVACWLQDPVNPYVVDESYCIAQRLQRPAMQQACNMHPCAAEYRVSSLSVCSVTCGEGQQIAEVTCVGSGGDRLDDYACHGLAKPPSVQTCQRPACQAQITWHVTDYGLCTRSCGGGVRERRVGCFDTHLNPYPEARCRMASRPVSVETCNSQPCPRAQMVPSVQDPRGQESTTGGFVAHVPGDPSASRPQTDITYNPYIPVTGPHCAQSYYGCCPDGHTSATGPRNEGCSQDDCVRTRFGCCLDGVTPVQGFGYRGCPEYRSGVLTGDTGTPNLCSLPRDEGPCDTWKPRFYYDSVTHKCTRFWYGGCQGNVNNFVSLEACQTECGGVVREHSARSSSRGRMRTNA